MHHPVFPEVVHDGLDHGREHGRHLGFLHLTHRVAGKRIYAPEGARDLVGGKLLLAPIPQLAGFRARRSRRDPGCTHALSPVRVVHAHHGQVRHVWMAPVRFLDFQRRDLVTPGLEDVDAPATQDPKGPAFDDGFVTRSEPPVRECALRLVRLAPVLPEDLRSPHLDFAAFPRADRLVPVIHQPDLHPGKRLPHVSGTPLAVERVREPHSDLGHAVPLEEGVPRDRLPPPQGGNRQRRGA